MIQNSPDGGIAAVSQILTLFRNLSRPETADTAVETMNSLLESAIFDHGHLPVILVVFVGNLRYILQSHLVFVCPDIA